MENQEQFTGINHSPTIAPHFAHLRALEPLKHLEVEMSVAIPKEGLDEALLADLVASMSKGVKKFAMTTHETVFEVVRFPDGFDLSIFYKHDKFAKVIPRANPSLEKQGELVNNACQSYLSSDWDSLAVYCVGLPREVHAMGVIPHCYLQRKLASVAAFRRDPEGGSVALKRTVEKIIGAGFLREVPRQTMVKKFANSSRAFQFSKSGNFFDLL